MSYTVFISAFRDGSPLPFPVAPVREAFEPHISGGDSTSWRLRYDDLNSSDVYLHFVDGSSTEITGLSVHRPCGDRRLWDALAAVLRLGPVVLYADFAPLIFEHATAAHLPKEMVEALGSPVCITTGDEILHAIQNA
jgi:hypothetical protein